MAYLYKKFDSLDTPEMQGKVDAAEQAKQGIELELAEAQKALTAAQKEAAELRASSGASANAIIESCEKRLRILEYDLVSKQEEISRLEKVKDDAFHKMTLMKWKTVTMQLKNSTNLMSVSMCCSWHSCRLQSCHNAVQCIERYHFQSPI